MPHRFRVTQRVRFMAGAHERNWAGVYEVVRLLPDDKGSNQYRIRSVKDDHQRVVFEDQLSAE